MIRSANRGAVLYLSQEGRGHGLFEKIEEIVEMNSGRDTVEACEIRGLKADIREYNCALPLLEHVNFPKSVSLITNNPEKVRFMEMSGYDIVKRIPIVARARDQINNYLEVKRTKLNHIM